MSDDAHDEPHPQVADGRGKTQLETQNAYHVKYTPRIYLYLDLLIDNKHDASNAEGTNGANGKQAPPTHGGSHDSGRVGNSSATVVTDRH